MRYEDRERKRLVHRGAVLRIESPIYELSRKIQELKVNASEEKEKTNKAVGELLNLRRSRQASVALNVWLPEIIRDRQRQMIQQSNVSVDFRINSLETELNLCEQQVVWIDQALRVQTSRLGAAQVL